MSFFYENVGCAIRRVSAFARATRLLRKPKGADCGPFGNPSWDLSPLDSKESALLCRYHLVPRYGPCSVVYMRFLPA